MTSLRPNTAVEGRRVELELVDVPADQNLAGSPRTGIAELGDLGGVSVGIWEMTEGTMSDVEAEEVFVVLSGRATVAFEDGSETLHLGPGDITRFAAGTRTVWTVTERLRKVYVT